MSLKTAVGSEHRLSDIMLTHDAGTVVLRHLASTQERVKVCRSVSKECRQLVDSSVTSLKANLQCLSDPSNKLVLNFPKLHELSFTHVSGRANDMLLQLAQHKQHLLGNLVSLDLSSCKSVESATLEELLIACKRLLRLKLPEMASSDPSSRHEFMDVLCKHGTSLLQLQGAGDYICTATIPQLTALSNLQSLDISSDRTSLISTAAALRPLSSVTTLQQLRLGNHLAGYEAFALVACLPQLSSLEFSYVTDCNMGPSDYAPLASCRNLQQLTLSGVSCTDELLSVLASTGVTSLTLDAAVGMFVASPKGAEMMRQQLRHLQLRVNAKDSAALALALTQFRNLTSLSLAVLRTCEDFSALLQAVFGLPRLQKLSLCSHYSGLREQDVAGLPVLQTLTSLSLVNHFSDATSGRVLSAVPQLQHLELISCVDISDSSLSNIVRCCKGLRSLRLELMRGISAAGVAAVAAGRCVQSVVLEGCRNVLASECQEIMQRLNKPYLEITKLK